MASFWRLVHLRVVGLCFYHLAIDPLTFQNPLFFGLNGAQQFFCKTIYWVKNYGYKFYIKYYIVWKWTQQLNRALRWPFQLPFLSVYLKWFLALGFNILWRCSLNFSASLFLSLCLSISLSVCVSLFLSMCLSLYFCMSISFSICVSLSLYAYLFLYMCLSLCLYVYLTLYVYVSLFLSVRESLSLLMSVFVSHLSLSLSVIVCLSVFVSLSSSLCISVYFSLFVNPFLSLYFSHLPNTFLFQP